MSSPDNTNPSERLATFRNSLGYSQAEMARKLGKKQRTYSHYENGRFPPEEVQRDLVYLGLNPVWHLIGRGEMKLPSPETLESSHRPVSPSKRVTGALSVQDQDTVARLEELGIELHPIFRVRVEASAGHGIEVYPEDEIEEVAEWLPASYIRRRYGVPPSRVKRLVVRGNSMKGTIEPGQEVRVALWEGERLHHGWIYVLHSPFGTIIKRLWLRKDHVILHSDNEAEEDETLPGEEFEEHYQVIAWLLERIEPL